MECELINLELVNLMWNWNLPNGIEWNWNWQNGIDPMSGLSNAQIWTCPQKNKL